MFTFKEIFEIIVNANKMQKIFGEKKQYYLEYHDEKFRTYKDFKKYVRTEINAPWKEVLLSNIILIRYENHFTFVTEVLNWSTWEYYSEDVAIYQGYIED